MAYATFSKGFEPGRVNSGALGLDDPADVVSAPFKAEVATNYEAGLKGSVADGKLVFELAGFYIDTKDRQVETRALIGSTPLERSEEHTSELQSLMRISYAVFC